jgi:hypothetical protein
MMVESGELAWQVDFVDSPFSGMLVTPQVFN